MSKHRYLQLDVFGGQDGHGKPLGVVLDAQTLSSEQMQQIAAWLNLSETIFSCRSARPMRTTTSVSSRHAPSCRSPATPASALRGRRQRTGWWRSSLMAGCASNALPACCP